MFGQGSELLVKFVDFLPVRLLDCLLDLLFLLLDSSFLVSSLRFLWLAESQVGSQSLRTVKVSSPFLVVELDVASGASWTTASLLVIFPAAENWLGRGLARRLRTAFELELGARQDVGVGVGHVWFPIKG